MKIIITGTRNKSGLESGWTEQELANYLRTYSVQRVILPRIKNDFPEFDFTVEVED